MKTEVKLLRQSDKQAKDGTYLWDAECFCGKTFTTLRRSVLNFHVRSCGCLKGISARQRCLENRKTEPSPTVIINTKFYRYKTKARLKKQKFDLSHEQFRALTEMSCHYCGEFEVLGIGLDRLDSCLGYEETNVVPCCSRCNYIKGGISYEEFKSFISKVYLNIIKYDGS